MGQYFRQLTVHYWQFSKFPRDVLRDHHPFVSLWRCFITICIDFSYTHRVTWAILHHKETVGLGRYLDSKLIQVKIPLYHWTTFHVIFFNEVNKAMSLVTFWRRPWACQKEMRHFNFKLKISLNSHQQYLYLFSLKSVTFMKYFDFKVNKKKSCIGSWLTKEM